MKNFVEIVCTIVDSVFSENKKILIDSKLKLIIHYNFIF